MSLSRLVLTVACLLWAGGCQRYAPMPLDLDQHRQAMDARDAGSSEVVEYARRLADQTGEPQAQYDPADGLSLAEAEVVALFFNAELRAARLRARVPAVGAAEAGRWEDPELAVDAERIIESVEHPWVVGGALRLTLPLSGRLGVEKKKAAASAAVEQLRVLAQERQVVAEVRAAWLQWSAMVEQISLTRALLAELEGIVQTAEKLRAAGELDPLDARLLRIERLTQAGKLQTLEAEARGAEIELRSRLGVAPAAEVKLLPSLNVARREGPTAEGAALLLREHPRVRVARAEYEVAERALELEIRRQYGDLSVGGGFGSDESIERVLGGLSLPLPLWNRNRRAIAEARAQREAARAEAEREYELLLSDAARAGAALDAAAARLRFMETELAPLVDEQLEAARKLGRLGNYNTLVLLEALKAVYDAKFELVKARLNVGLSNARLRSLMETDTAGGAGGQEMQP